MPGKAGYGLGHQLHVLSNGFKDPEGKKLVEANGAADAAVYMQFHQPTSTPIGRPTGRAKVK
jgi:hypothetical protein